MSILNELEKEIILSCSAFRPAFTAEASDNQE